MRFCLVKPDMPSNFGTIVRTLACFGVFEIDIIMPIGFTLNDKDVKRSMMDYGENFSVKRWDDFCEYKKQNEGSRFILATTKSDKNFSDIKYLKNDIIVFGSESKGVSDEIHKSCDEKITIFMPGEKRSLNLAVSFGIVAHFAIFDSVK